MINESVTSSSLLVRSFTVYKLLSMLSTPFSSFDSFRRGYIDYNGNFKEKLDYLIQSGKIDPLEVLVIKLKKLLMMIPNPGVRSRLDNQLTLIDLFLSEMYQYGVEPHETLYLLETHCLKNGFSLLDYLIEDTTVGGGDVAGLLITDIIGPKQKDLKDPYREKKKLLRRKPLEEPIAE